MSALFELGEHVLYVKHIQETAIKHIDGLERVVQCQILLLE